MICQEFEPVIFKVVTTVTAYFNEINKFIMIIIVSKCNIFQNKLGKNNIALKNNSKTLQSR